jgi:Ftsk gamma domain
MTNHTSRAWMHGTGEYTVAELMEVFSVGRATVYRVLDRAAGKAAQETSASPPEIPGAGTGLLIEAARLVITRPARASAGALQRDLRIGYQRAAIILDQLHVRGITGPAKGNKPRDVLASSGQLEVIITRLQAEDTSLPEDHRPPPDVTVYDALLPSRQSRSPEEESRS